MKEPINALPMGARGKALTTTILLGLAAIWIISLYWYFRLPEEIVTHFGLSGKPTSHGDKLTFLLLPIALSIGPAILLTLTQFRFTLINKYPYLINLPAFYTHIYELPERRRSDWVNTYFELMLALGLALTLFMLFLLIAIIEGTLAGELPWWFVVAIILMPILLIAPFFYYLSVLSKKMQVEIDGGGNGDARRTGNLHP